jgi:hypothetical protein
MVPVFSSTSNLNRQINYFFTAGESFFTSVLGAATAGESVLGATTGESVLGATTGESVLGATAGESVFVVDSVPLLSLQAANAATTAKAKNTFFIFCNF